LGLLYPPPRRSIDERILAEHPFGTFRLR
jgi:hypothetical protein